MANAWYSHWSDNVLRKLVPDTVFGTTVTAFPKDHLTDEAPVSLWKITGTTFRVFWNKGVPTKIDWVLLGQHNLDAGLANVVFQGHTTDDFTSPSLSAAFTIPGTDGDGFRINPRLDLTGFSSRTFQYWSLAALTANSSPIALGECMAFGTKRVAQPNISWGATQEDERAVVHMPTKAGAGGAYDEGVWRREWNGEIDCTDAEAALFRQWYRDARGTARTFAYVPDGDVNDAWIVKFGMPLKRTFAAFNRNVYPVRFIEADRGINID